MNQDEEDRENFQISRVLHAGYVFKHGQTEIIFDPVFENPFSINGHAFPNVAFDHQKIQEQRFDAIFISHIHDDHCSFESLNWLRRETPLYIYCQFETLFELLRELGFKSVHSLRLNHPVKVGGITVTPRRALDVDVDCIFQIEAAGLKVLNVVDSWIDEQTLDLLIQQGPWDLILWPFQTMREIEVLAPSRATPAPARLPKEWMLQLSALRPMILVPSSCQFLLEPWSWYNHAFFPISYRFFENEMASVLPWTKVLRIAPSQSMTLSKSGMVPSGTLSWAKLMGSKDADYTYDPNLKVPSTADIAKHFPAMLSSQQLRVVHFCEHEIAQKLNELSPPEDSYFDKERLWRLSVYDHEGVARHYHYRIGGREMQQVSWPLAHKEALDSEFIETSNSVALPLAWTTEISIAKLFAALEQGESLSSLYIRINDVQFEPAVEKEINNVDIMEDPLIRILFNGSIAAYQAAQLQRIKATGRLRT